MVHSCKGCDHLPILTNSDGVCMNCDEYSQYSNNLIIKSDEAREIRSCPNDEGQQRIDAETKISGSTETGR